MYIYKTHGTCSREIHLEIDADDIIKEVTFVGGCRGNTQGVASLCVGRNAHDVQKLLMGIPCQGATSCPDQLSKAIEQYYSQNK